jgi:ABC-type bacteriocin/lantibiotic exporter with double-glycine peptidase domain
MMAVIDCRFALVVLALGVLSIWITAFFNKKLEKSGDMLQEANAGSTDYLYELIKGAKTLRLLKLQPYLRMNVSTKTQAEADAKIEVGRITTRMKALTAAVSALTTTLILVAGALFVYFRLTDWGSVAALMLLKGNADGLFIYFGQRVAGMQTSIAGIKRLFALMASPAETETDRVPMAIKPTDAALTLNNVSFGYTGEAVLDGFNLTLHKTGLTVLVGESGAGKSTVIKLILGLYTPDSGNIVFDGVEEPTLESIRAKTAYVPQEPMLLRASILENIRFGNPAASMADAVRAAQLAGADGLITGLEAGYETLLTDDGRNLSGGQRQRLALARALVKDAPILLLDEITSALDQVTKGQILETVKELGRTKAVLAVTHDPEIERIADRVIHI